MTCKDCIHQAACLNWCRGFRQEAKLCEHFSDKSEWFHFADKDCKTAYYALGYGNNARVIEEPIHGLAILKTEDTALSTSAETFTKSVKRFS